MFLSRRHSTQSDDWLLAIALVPENGTMLHSDVIANLSDRVLRLFAGLSRDQRAIITLRCFEGMSYRTIADVLNCSSLRAFGTFCRAKDELCRSLVKIGFSSKAIWSAILFFETITRCDSVPSQDAVLRTRANPRTEQG